MKLGLSILPSFHLLRRFLGIVLSGFYKFWHGARNPYEVVRDRTGFRRKICPAPQIEKMNEKWTKNMVFEFIEKFCH